MRAWKPVAKAGAGTVAAAAGVGVLVDGGGVSAPALDGGPWLLTAGEA